jgi:hypothetical protein
MVSYAELVSTPENILKPFNNSDARTNPHVKVYICFHVIYIYIQTRRVYTHHILSDHYDSAYRVMVARICFGVKHGILF